MNGRDLLHRTRLELLRTTIAHAYEHSPYYRRTWHDVDRDIASLDDLSRFPLISKTTLREASHELLTDPAMPKTVQFTGGTLASPAIVHHGLQEGEVARRRASLYEERNDSGRAPLSLSILVPTNGLATMISPAFVVPLVLEKHFWHVDALLSRDFQYTSHEPRITRIAAPLERLKLLTAYYLENGYDFSKYRVRTLLTGATHLTPRWRGILEDTWSSTVHDIYGLSEVSGAVFRYCQACQAYHLDPTGVAEVISLTDRLPIGKGVGELVLTSLYPFVQLQPQIRYETADLVEVFDGCDRVDDLSYRYLGRIAQSVVAKVDGETLALLRSIEVADALDELVDANIEPAALITGLRTTDVGYFRWKGSAEDISDGRLQLVLSVELRYWPQVYSAQTARVRRHLKEKLLARNAPLMKHVTTGRVTFDVRFTPPGTLSPVIV